MLHFLFTFYRALCLLNKCHLTQWAPIDWSHRVNGRTSIEMNKTQEIRGKMCRNRWMQSNRSSNCVQNWLNSMSVPGWHGQMHEENNYVLFHEPLCGRRLSKLYSKHRWHEFTIGLLLLLIGSHWCGCEDACIVWAQSANAYVRRTCHTYSYTRIESNNL